MEEKKKMKSNTEEDYNKVLASEDPTNISKEEQERLTREAIKKFKSLSQIDKLPYLLKLPFPIIGTEKELF